MPTHLLYLHGFRSSPQSAKAQMVAKWVAAYNAYSPTTGSSAITLACPQLPPSPREAMALLTHITATWPLNDTVVIGSSLGGYYATAFMRQTGCRGWLINPAVHPARDLTAYMQQANPPHPPEDDHFFNARYIDELRAINPHPIAAWLPAEAQLPQHMGVLIAKGDEVLNWQEMHAAYAHHPSVHIRLLEGGDHTVSDFAVHLPEVLRFLGGQEWDNPGLFSTPLV